MTSAARIGLLILLVLLILWFMGGGRFLSEIIDGNREIDRIERKLRNQQTH